MSPPIEFESNHENQSQKIVVSRENETDFKEKIFTCDLCGKEFRRKASLTVHVNSHKENGAFNDFNENNEKEVENVCSICYKKFTAKKNLLKHLRDVHKNFKEAARMVVKKIKCPEGKCDFKCRMMKELRDHIEVCHRLKILKDTLEFPSESAFQKWKKEEESNTVSWFVTGRKKSTLIGGTKRQILYCHRTGRYNPKGLGKYRMRSVGSCKIGVTCPAAMEVTEHSDGHLKVIYYKTHLGHVQDVAYLKLSREEKANLAEDVKEGIEANDSKTKRIHFLSKKDLYSIMRSSSESQERRMKGKTADIGSDFQKQGCQVGENEKRSQEEDLGAGNSESSKINRNVQQNITLYPGQGVILPQGYSEVDGSSVVRLSKVPNLAQSLGEEISSQILILSREIDCNSVAKIILLSAGETLAQSRISPQNKILGSSSSSGVAATAATARAAVTAATPEFLSLREKNRLNKSNLRQRLKEKMDRIVEFLPRSEFLTPNQFSLINRKLDAILNLFGEVDAKRGRGKRNGGKRRGGKRGTFEKEEENAGEKKQS